jgi:hypothetical protein
MAAEAEGHPPSATARGEKRLARGLEDVTHLFISQPAEESTAEGRDQRIPDDAPSRLVRRSSMTVMNPASAVTREQLTQLLMVNTAALEGGLRAIDADVPCGPGPPISLLAIDGLNQLVLIALDTSAGDGLLLRAVAHYDWLAQNIPILRRMYQGQVINFSTSPRIFLVAPQFSPELVCAVRAIAAPLIHCVRYHTIAVTEGTGIFFDLGIGPTEKKGTPPY